MHFKESIKSDWSNQAFWEKIVSLEIGSEKPIPNPTSTSRFEGFDPKRSRECLRKRGYALVDECVFPQEKLVQIRKGIEQLHALGYPASFILLFDVTWDIAAISRDLFQKSCLESNQFQFDILAWHITGEGFSPHRDRQPEDAKSTFVGEDAKFVTQWIALTPATPQNSCLYMIPKECDPGYLAGDSDEQDPLRRALPDKARFQKIVALPRDEGQSLLFTHRIIHWGSARDPNAPDALQPRIAISFVCSDPSYEKPYLSNQHFTSERRPPFHIRLLLVCAQLLIYYQRFNLPRDALRICYQYCKENEKELEETYRKKVYLEFVKAMKEHEKEETEGTPSDDEEAVLDAMLEAEEGGYGDDFTDDYDEDVGEDEDYDEVEKKHEALSSEPQTKRVKTGD